MRSFGLICSALLFTSAPASAAALDTDTDTDTDTGFVPHPPPSIEIESPDDGAVFEGTPDAVVPVELSFSYMNPGAVSLHVDDVATGSHCVDEWACIIEVTLTPGVHKLQAFGSGFESEVVMVEVRDGSTGASTGTDATTTDASTTDASETATDSDGGGGGGGGEKSGCGCSADGGGAGASGLVLLSLLALRRRRTR